MNLQKILKGFLVIILASIVALNFNNTAQADEAINLPDLTIQGLTSFENSNDPGNSYYKYYFTAKNIGEGEYLRNSNIYGYSYVLKSANGNIKDQGTWYGLITFRKDEVKTDSHQLRKTQVTAGDLLILKIDPDNYVVESDEANNEKTFTITQEMINEALGLSNALPDLSIQDLISFENSNDPGNSYYKYYFTAKNIGEGEYLRNSNIYGYSYVLKSANGNIKDQGTWYGLITFRKDEVKTDSHQLRKTQVTAGDLLILKIDPDNYVVESDEANNEKTFTITQEMINEALGVAATLPDLIVEDYLTINQNNDGRYSLKYKIKNAGQKDITNFPWVGRVQLTVNNQNGQEKYSDYLYQIINLEIKTGQSTSDDSSYINSDKLIAKDKLTITVDPLNLLTETDESNNSKTFTITQDMLPKNQTKVDNNAYQPKNTNESKKVLNNIKGKIVLQVEKKGEAYYVTPDTKKIYYLKNGETAYQVMRESGLGISEKNFLDLMSANNNGSTLRKRLAGKIVLRVHAHGEAYYINPINLSVTYMPDGEAAYQIMRQQSLGISDKDLNKVIETE